jgi:hypothetical protein
MRNGEHGLLWICTYVNVDGNGDVNVNMEVLHMYITIELCVRFIQRERPHRMLESHCEACNDHINAVNSYHKWSSV